jgi:hypothetical protein
MQKTRTYWRLIELTIRYWSLDATYHDGYALRVQT